jgi:hypothetical protein
MSSAKRSPSGMHPRAPLSAPSTYTACVTSATCAQLWYGLGGMRRETTAMKSRMARRLMPRRESSSSCRPALSQTHGQREMDHACFESQAHLEEDFCTQVDQGLVGIGQGVEVQGAKPRFAVSKVV